jgi:hypothetical protein
MKKHKYPIGGFAPGNYMYRCVTCTKYFRGDKIADQCEPCAIKMVANVKKCTCERPDDNTCDYCDEKQSIEILKEAKERHNFQEAVEQAAKKYHEDNQFKSNHPHCPYSFIDGAKWAINHAKQQDNEK